MFFLQFSARRNLVRVALADTRELEADGDDDLGCAYFPADSEPWLAEEAAAETATKPFPLTRDIGIQVSVHFHC